MNLKSKNSLNDHLLPGLNPIGVPKYLKNKVHPFSMNDFKGFKDLYSKYKIGIAIIEIARTSMPNVEFLKRSENSAIKIK